MDRKITLFSEPEELVAWAEVYDKQLSPSIEDAEILLNYMEGHDYAIGTDAEGKMYRQDMAVENGEIEPFPIDDVIDIDVSAEEIRSTETEELKTAVRKKVEVR